MPPQADLIALGFDPAGPEVYVSVFFVIQRFGSDLRLNVHLHALFLDGAFGSERSFFTAAATSPKDMEQILARIVARAKKILEERQGALSDVEDGEASLAQPTARPPAHAAPPSSARTTSSGR